MRYVSPLPETLRVVRTHWRPACGAGAVDMVTMEADRRADHARGSLCIRGQLAPGSNPFRLSRGAKDGAELEQRVRPQVTIAQCRLDAAGGALVADGDEAADAVRVVVGVVLAEIKNVHVAGPCSAFADRRQATDVAAAASTIAQGPGWIVRDSADS